MKNYLKPNQILYLWALFDIFYIVRFIYLNISQGRIPLINDIVSFCELYPQQGVYSLVIFACALLLNISIVFSAVMLLLRWQYVRWVIWAQTPLRLFFMIPSISVLPWMFNAMSIKAGLIFFVAVCLSELIKVTTIHLSGKAYQ